MLSGCPSPAEHELYCIFSFNCVISLQKVPGKGHTMSMAFAAPEILYTFNISDLLNYSQCSEFLLQETLPSNNCSTQPKLLTLWIVHIIIDIDGNKTTTNFVTAVRFLHSKSGPFYF